MNRSRVWMVAAAIVLAAPAVRADPLPPWLTEAARSSVPESLGADGAVVLLRERTVQVQATGRRLVIDRIAVKILSPSTYSRASGSRIRLIDSDRVHSERAWLLRPGRPALAYGRDRVIELNLGDELRSGSRTRVLEAGRAAGTGSIFGYEAVVDEGSILAQEEWRFQEDLPVVRSRYRLTLPDGWHAEVRADTGRSERVSGEHMWERRDLAGIHGEPSGPSIPRLVPWLRVSWFPPPNADPGLAAFASWAEVARWLWTLTDPRADSDAALTAHTAAVLDSAHNEIDTLRAVAADVQKVLYASIAMGIGGGGGYLPRPATEVLVGSYGDCKDKANLMRAMLKYANIPSYLVAVHSSDRRHVREEWPSPEQFDHCILGVEARRCPAEWPSVEVAGRRLLFFDPTDPATPIGDLPMAERGSLALVMSLDSDTLVRLPEAQVERNRTERRLELSLEPARPARGVLRVRQFGPLGAHERWRYDSSPLRYHQTLEDALVADAAGLRVDSTRFATNGDASFESDIWFEMAAIADTLAPDTLLLRLGLLGFDNQELESACTRTLPVLLLPRVVADTVIVTLPEGFRALELPEDLDLREPFGSFLARWWLEERSLRCTRSMTIADEEIPGFEFERLRQFLVRAEANDQFGVLLARDSLEPPAASAAATLNPPAVARRSPRSPRRRRRHRAARSA